VRLAVGAARPARAADAGRKRDARRDRRGAGLVLACGSARWRPPSFRTCRSRSRSTWPSTFASSPSPSACRSPRHPGRLVPALQASAITWPRSRDEAQARVGEATGAQRAGGGAGRAGPPARRDGGLMLRALQHADGSTRDSIPRNVEIRVVRSAVAALDTARRRLDSAEAPASSGAGAPQRRAREPRDRPDGSTGVASVGAIEPVGKPNPTPDGSPLRLTGTSSRRASSRRCGSGWWRTKLQGGDRAARPGGIGERNARPPAVAGRERHRQASVTGASPSTRHRMEVWRRRGRSVPMLARRRGLHLTCARPAAVDESP